MGNNAASLIISTDKKTYSVGEIVKGKLLLKVDSDVPATVLHLRVNGEEVTNFNWYSIRDFQHHHDESRRSIISLTVPVAVFAYGIVEAGQYEFPFETVLPAWLPPSMKCELEQSTCRVRYVVEAFIGRTQLEYLHKVHTVHDITIYGSPDEALVERARPVVTQPSVIDAEEIYLLRCINRGRMTVQSELDVPFATRGSFLKIGFACKNMSSAVLHGVIIKIVETISWRSGKRCSTFSRVVAQKWIPSRFFSPSAVIEENLGSSLMEVQKQYIPLHVPLRARNSYSGRIITITHNVEVIFTVSSLFQPSPRISMPVTLRPPADKELHQQEIIFCEESCIPSFASSCQLMQRIVLHGEEGVLPLSGCEEKLESDGGNDDSLLSWSPHRVETCNLPLDQAHVGGDEIVTHRY